MTNKVKDLIEQIDTVNNYMLDNSVKETLSLCRAELERLEAENVAQRKLLLEVIPVLNCADNLCTSWNAKIKLPNQMCLKIQELLFPQPPEGV